MPIKSNNKIIQSILGQFQKKFTKETIKKEKKILVNFNRLSIDCAKKQDRWIRFNEGLHENWLEEIQTFSVRLDSDFCISYLCKVLSIH